MTVKINKLSPGVKRVLINDPKTYNSLSYKTLSSLLMAFKKLDNDKETRVIILEGDQNLYSLARRGKRGSLQEKSQIYGRSQGFTSLNIPQRNL